MISKEKKANYKKKYEQKLIERNKQQLIEGNKKIPCMRTRRAAKEAEEAGENSNLMATSG